MPHSIEKPVSNRTAADATIRKLIDHLVSSWNAGDGVAYAAAFTERCDYITFNGEHHKSRAAVASSHQELFDTHLKGSQLLVGSYETRPIGPDTVLVNMIGNTTTGPGRKPRASRRSTQTLVAVNADNGWRFTAFHNTRIFRITAFRALLMSLGL